MQDDRRYNWKLPFQFQSNQLIMYNYWVFINKMDTSVMIEQQMKGRSFRSTDEGAEFQIDRWRGGVSDWQMKGRSFRLTDEGAEFQIDRWRGRVSDWQMKGRSFRLTDEGAEFQIDRWRGRVSDWQMKGLSFRLTDVMYLWHYGGGWWTSVALMFSCYIIITFSWSTEKNKFTYTKQHWSML